MTKHRHQFTYPKQRGTSSPRCLSNTCRELNPRYRPADDPIGRLAPFWGKRKVVKFYPGGVIYRRVKYGRFQHEGKPYLDTKTASWIERAWVSVHGSGFTVDLTYKEEE